MTGKINLSNAMTRQTTLQTNKAFQKYKHSINLFRLTISLSYMPSEPFLHANSGLNDSAMPMPTSKHPNPKQYETILRICFYPMSYHIKS